jgi:hypothetical protein
MRGSVSTEPLGLREFFTAPHSRRLKSYPLPSNNFGSVPR